MALLTVCPNCRSTDVRRSVIRFYEFLVAAFFIPLRCRDCRERFWRLRFVATVKARRVA
jgi:hypothetical protein